MIIDDLTGTDTTHPPGFERGLVPRDYAVYPATMFAPPSQLQLIPRSDWSARIKEMVETRSRLSDIRETMANGSPMPSLDQNGQGFCWAYSTGATIMFSRAANNLPYVRLSPHAVACKIMDFADRGAWCGLSAKFARETGYPSAAVWPEKSMSRQYDKAVTWEDAARHKVTEDWVDLTVDVWEQNLTFDAVMTCLMSRVPVAVDFNWWGHSVCALDPVEVEPGSFGIRIINSWTDAWGDRGMGVLRGNRSIPDGAIATRVTTTTT